MANRLPLISRGALAAVGVGIASAAALLALLVFVQTRATEGRRPSNVDVSPADTSVGVPLQGPTPADMADLASGWVYPHEIVAVAVVSDIISVGPAATPTPDPTEIAEHPDLPPHPPVTYTLFSLLVERVILDDGTIAAGDPLVIVRQGPPEYEGFHIPMEQVGDRYLYFLIKVSDFPGVYGSDWAAHGRLLVDGTEVMYSGFTPEPVGFARHTPPAQFIDELATEIAVQYPQATATP